MIPRFPFAILMPLVAFTAFGCSLMHKPGAGDGGADGAVAAGGGVDAGSTGSTTPVNVNQVGRFPDEVSVNDVEEKIADPIVSARNSVPGGVLVAMLRLGTPVTQIAKHEGFVLGTFPDPKNPTRRLEGWIAEQAFIAGASVPRKSACPKGQTQLVFDEQDFCGKPCKTDADCAHGQACGGKANLLVKGQPGAEISTCTVPAGAAGGGADAGSAASGGGSGGGTATPDGGAAR